MTWLKFAFWLLGVYSFYYAGIIFWDYLQGNRTVQQSNKQELVFVEDIEPEKTYPDDPPAGINGSPVVSSGGVSLKQLFNLAREESVEYIKSVSF